MNKKYVAILLTVLFLTNATFAAEWKYSLGTNYRKLGEISYQEFSLSNPNFAGSQFIDGLVPGTFPGQFTIDDYAQQVNNVGGDDMVTFRTVNFSGMSDDINDAKGIILGASTELKPGWSLDLSLTTVLADESTNAATTTAYTSYNFGPVGSWLGGATTNIGNPIPGVDPIPAQTNISLSFDLDLNIYTFSGGISKNIQMDPFSLSVGLGSSLSIVQYEHSRFQAADWSSSGANIYSKKEEDDDIKIMPGLYINAAVTYDITKKIGVQLGARYDYIPEDLSTDFADIELSGLSAEFKIIYSF